MQNRDELKVFDDSCFCIFAAFNLISPCKKFHLKITYILSLY